MKIKPLVWSKIDAWWARSPFGYRGGYTIDFEAGKYYAPMTVFPQGFSTLEEAKAACQEHHDNHVRALLTED